MAYKKGGKQPNALPHSKRIANKVREMAPTTNVKEIFSSIQKYQNAPRSLSTFYKLYRVDLEEAKADIAQKIGDKVINSALNGDEDNPLTHKSREFYLDRKGGWSKKETVEHREVDSEEEENKSAVESLMSSLGIDAPEE